MNVILVIKGLVKRFMYVCYGVTPTGDNLEVATAARNFSSHFLQYSSQRSGEPRRARRTADPTVDTQS